MRFVAAPFTAAIILMSVNIARADDVWGAVSIADDGAFASAWNRSSRTDALNDVKRRCRENSSLPESCSNIDRIHGMFFNQATHCRTQRCCRSLRLCRRGWSSGVSSRLTVSE